mmetsp:Transcript_46829/g.141855  ORF Transcript_46829/g.141855 Transcript_46829/m.141855 type:complete len:304 (-) Transcript_46829:106-1017(-)
MQQRKDWLRPGRPIPTNGDGTNKWRRHSPTFACSRELIDEGASHGGNDVRLLRLSLSGLPPTRELEYALNDADLGRRRIQPHEGGPIVHDQPSAQHVRSSIHSPRHQRHLKQSGQFLDILDGRAGMDHSPLIGELRVRSDQSLTGDGLTEHLHSQYVRDDVLSLSINVGMDEGDVIVAGDDVPQRRQPLLDALNDDAVGERIPEMSQFLIGRRVGDDETAAIADGRASHESTSADGGVYDGNVLGQFRFEDGVEVLGSADTREAVRVGQGGEDADFVRIFVGATGRHDLAISGFASCLCCVLL